LASAAPSANRVEPPSPGRLAAGENAVTAKAIQKVLHIARSLLAGAQIYSVYLWTDGIRSVILAVNPAEAAAGGKGDSPHHAK
jgi:hypothetical protein